MSDDAWFWTVEDLVTRLCRSKDVFQTAGCGTSQIPDPTALENLLRNQKITGASFLNSPQSPAIRDAFAAFSLKQRLALLTVIDFLQRQSLGYKQHDATTGVQSINIGDEGRASALSSVRTSDAIDKMDANARKRQKLIHVDTVPASVMREYSQESVTEAGAWDHLLRWNLVDNGEDIADLDEEEDPEDEDEEEDGFEDPLDDTRGLDEASQGQYKMSPDQVVDIINERIDHYTKSWSIEKEKDVIYDPVAMWEKANATGQREQLVKMYENDVAYYGQRLDKLCDEILDGYNTSGGSIATVRLQCRNLETTVELMELAGWLRDLYQRQSAEESQEELDSSSSIQGDTVETFPTHQRQNSTEIVDLGSPAESSENDREGTAPAHVPQGPATHVDQCPSTSSRRIRTPDSAVAETIERLAHTQTDIHPRTLSKLSPRTGTDASFGSPRFHGDEPENSSIRTVRSWKWADLIETQDRKRIVSKAVLEMNSEDREMIRIRLKFVGKTNMMKEIHACVVMLVAKESRMQGVLPRDVAKILIFTRLFLCWWMCHKYSTAEPSAWRLEELARCLEEGNLPDPAIFCDYLSTIMSTTFSEEALKHPEQPSQREVINLISDDEDEISIRPPPRGRDRENRTINWHHTSPVVLD